MGAERQRAYSPIFGTCGADMNQKPDATIFQLSELGERIVRTYKCISLKRWFVPPTVGYLTVTNKRVVFHSSGRSITGKSLLLSEMPLEDVAGIRVYEGLSINWLLFLIVTGMAYWLTQGIVALLPSFLISYWFALLLMLPAAFIWLMRTNILSRAFKDQILDIVGSIVDRGAETPPDLESYYTFARIPFYLGLAILGWRLAFSSELGLGASFAPFLILLAIYAYIFMDLVGRRSSFTIQIGSKTAKDTGIFIPGDSFNFLPGRETTALQGLGARPAEDAGRVIRELGALVMDMQQLGDHAIQKWSDHAVE